MLMPKLTAVAVAKYTAAAKRREIRDALSPGLYLVIQPKPKGSKSWAMRFRRPDGKPAKLTLGRVDLSEGETTDEPTLGGALTLRAARQLSNSIDRERARGIDVIEHYKAKALRDDAAKANRAANTFGTIAREFFADHKVKGRGARPRRWRADARLIGLRWPLAADPAKDEPEVIGGSLAATWADKPLADIDGHDVHAVVDDARKRGIPGLARHNKGVSDARGRKMHAALSNLFRWALQHRKVTVNPTVGVWHPGAPPTRERVLTNAEVVTFWKACERISPPYGALFKLLLLTGARLNEVAGMRRDELSEDGSVWTLPGERTKNHRPLVLALPPLARNIIAELPTIDGGFVFTVSGRRAVTSWTLMKAALDKAMGTTTKPWRLHDLRRTATTGMAELGILPHVIEAVLNHISGFKGGVAGIYNRATYAAEKKMALERWAAHIDGLVHEREATVTPLHSLKKT
jgi:integrase